jgi:DNA helicase HerA-like ATPase
MSSSGRPWLDEEARAILNLLTRRNDQNSPIRGFRALVPFRDYHSSRRTEEIVDEIYQHLTSGRIVILDLALGPETIRTALSERIASGIFSRSMQVFVSGRLAPNILLYVEEAHNLIGRDSDPNETWPRIAKEGAKYRLGLVYATQEPSSMSPNVLANTENWFVTHLNNEDEVRRLSKYYDFADFATSLIRAQDVGFARVKMLSSPFVVPIQIDLFDISTWEANLSSRADQTGPTQSGPVRRL